MAPLHAHGAQQATPNFTILRSGRARGKSIPALELACARIGAVLFPQQLLVVEASRDRVCREPADLLTDPSTTFVDDDGPADEPIDEFAAEDPRPRRGREGLPPGFRMRHESHYVDDLSAAPTIRQVAISEIDRDAAPDDQCRRSRA